MSSTPPPVSAADLRLHLAQRSDTHRDRLLELRARRGEFTRLRRGVSVDTAAFLSATPEQRHRLAAAATAAIKDRPVFCRETGLALHGVPMLRTPQAIHLRGYRKSRAGTSRDHPQLEAGRATQALLSRTSLSWTQAQRRLEGLSTKNVLAPIPAGHTRAEADAAYRRGALLLPREALTESGAVPADVSMPPLQTESLAFAVIDAVTSMNIAEAVVVIDAVLGGRSSHLKPLVPSDFEPWSMFLGTATSRDYWQRLVSFADARSESVGESWSRVLIHQLGFPAPALQQTFCLRSGRSARTDFFWPDCSLVGEFDGKVKYTRSQDLSGLHPGEVVFREKLREEALAELGLRTVRWSWEDLQNPQHLSARLERAGLRSSGLARLACAKQD